MSDMDADWDRMLEREAIESGDIDDHGPFDPEELVRWATSYGHPEGWAKKAQDLHGKLEALQTSRDAYQARLVEAINEVERLRGVLQDARQWALLTPEDPAGPDYQALLLVLDREVD